MTASNARRLIEAIAAAASGPEAIAIIDTHDREVRAAALREAVRYVRYNAVGTVSAADWLEIMADRAERGEP